MFGGAEGVFGSAVSVNPTQGTPSNGPIGAGREGLPSCGGRGWSCSPDLPLQDEQASGGT